MKRTLLLLMLSFFLIGFISAQNSGLDKDKEATIQNLHGPTVVVPPPGPMGGQAVGDDCTDPIVISLPADMPYSDLGQTNCGRGNTYSSTCLGSYDGGEDIIYRIDVTADVTVNISFDGKSTGWTGIAVIDDCPDVGDCVARATGSAHTKLLNGVSLTAADSPYYIIIDTWPSPNCVPDFDLTISEPPPPPPGDNCADALDLSAEISPYSSSTSLLTNDFSFCGLTSSNDFICYYDVEPNATIEIWQSYNNFDSRHTMRYGGDCPGTNLVACEDDPDYGHISWVNTTGSLERVWFILGGYSSNSGDFTLEWTYTPAPACPPPTGLVVTDKTPTTARLSWVGSGVSGYNWQVVPVGNDPDDSPVDQGSVLGDTTDVADGLIASTTYDAYVQSDCGGGPRDNEWIGPVTFTTACNTVTTFPLNEGFENGGDIPMCWSVEYVTGTEDWTFVNGGHNHHPASAAKGSYNALLYHNSWTPAVTRLVSPALDLSGAASPYLTFWHAQPEWPYGSNADQDELRVYYKTSASGAWTLIPGAEWTTNIPDWKGEIISLPNPSDDYYIAFEATGKYGYGVVVDNVQIGPTAPVPVSNWAIAIGVFFILTFLVVTYKRRFA